jgi:hypothetical protein
MEGFTQEVCYIPSYGSFLSHATSEVMTHSLERLHPFPWFTHKHCYISLVGSLWRIATSTLWFTQSSCNICATGSLDWVATSPLWVHSTSLQHHLLRFTQKGCYIHLHGSLVLQAISQPLAHSVAVLHRLKGFSHTLSAPVHPYRMYAGNRWLSFRFPIFQREILHGH